MGQILPGSATPARPPASKPKPRGSADDRATVWGGSRLLSGAQVDRVNRRIKQATVKRVHYDDPDQPARPLAKVISAYTFG